MNSVGPRKKPIDVSLFTVASLLSDILHMGKLSLRVRWHFSVFYSTQQALKRVSSWLSLGLWFSPLLLGPHQLLWVMATWASPLR